MLGVDGGPKASLCFFVLRHQSGMMPGFLLGIPASIFHRTILLNRVQTLTELPSRIRVLSQECHWKLDQFKLPQSLVNDTQRLIFLRADEDAFPSRHQMARDVRDR
jgi:hypothetical protein